MVRSAFVDRYSLAAHRCRHRGAASSGTIADLLGSAVIPRAFALLP